MKKIVIITGSPRKGATEGMADAFQAAAESSGIEIVRFNAAKLKVGGCRNCNACGKVAGRTCVFDDDFTQVAKAVLEAGGIALATPLYWYSWPWQIKATLDRFYSFLVGGFDLKGKKAALIASLPPTKSSFPFWNTTGIRTSLPRRSCRRRSSSPFRPSIAAPSRFSSSCRDSRRRRTRPSRPSASRR